MNIILAILFVSGALAYPAEKLENNANAPVILTNLNVDPYVVANCILHKCGWTFSKLDDLLDLLQ